MTYNAGYIDYTIDANTESLLTAEKQVSSFSSGAAKNLGRVTKAANQADFQLTKTSLAVRQSTSAFKLQKGAAQQAGFQLQDIAVQAQMGTSWFTILGQQVSQLAIVLGPGGALIGAVVAIGAAIGGVLYKSLVGTGKEAGNLYETMEVLNRVIVTSESGVAALSNEYAKLAKTNAEAARAMKAIAVSQAAIAIENSRKVVEQATDSFDGWFSSISLARKGINEMRRDGAGLEKQLKRLEVTKDLRGGYGELADLVSSASDEFELSTPAAYRLVVAMSDMQEAVTPDNIKALNSAISIASSELNKTGKAATSSGQKFIKMADGLLKANESAGASLKALEPLKNNIDAVGESFFESEKSVHSFINSLDDQVEALGKTEAQAAILSAQAKFGGEIWKIYGAEISGLINKLYAYAKAEEDAAAIADAASKKRYETSISPVFDFSKTAGGDTEARKQFDKLTEGYEFQGMTPLEQINERERIAIEELRQVKFEALASEEEYQQALTDLNQKYADERTALNEKETARSIELMSGFESASKRALTGLITGTTTAKEALSGLANTIATEAIGALIDMGIQYVKNAAISQAAQATSTAASIAEASAVGSAWATPAALVNSATYGAAAVAGAASLSSTVALSNSLAAAGGRQYGGPTSVGNMYRINEAGVPEVRSVGGKDYLMETQNAKITPLDKHGGSGQGSTYNITQNISGNMGDQSISKVVEMATKRAVGQVDNSIRNQTGSTHKALRQNSNYTGKPGG